MQGTTSERIIPKRSVRSEEQRNSRYSAFRPAFSFSAWAAINAVLASTLIAFLILSQGAEARASPDSLRVSPP